MLRTSQGTRRAEWLRPGRPPASLCVTCFKKMSYESSAGKRRLPVLARALAAGSQLAVMSASGWVQAELRRSGAREVGGLPREQAKLFEPVTQATTRQPQQASGLRDVPSGVL